MVVVTGMFVMLPLVFNNGLIVEWCSNTSTGNYTVTIPLSVTKILNIVKSYKSTSNTGNNVTPNEISTWTWETSNFKTYADFNGCCFIIFAY